LLLLAFSCLLLACEPTELPDPPKTQSDDWAVYGGDPGHQQYSPLAQVTPENVSQLEQAWTYHSAPGYELPTGSELQVNPLVIDGVLYGISPQSRVFALNAATGQRLWEFDPASQLAGMEAGDGESKSALLLSQKRGLTFWHDTQLNRLFFSVGHVLLCLDAANGKLITGFGDDGAVDLREGLGRPAHTLGVAGNTPGVIFNNLLIMGTRVSEHEAAAPGHIRAYDVMTGKIVWTFHTVPQPGEPGYETWPRDGWKRFGGVNAWAGMTVDHERGLVFAPLGAPSNDFVGIHRPGANLYGNSLLALDAATGRPHWHYQLVHHDLWDRDLNSAPTLAQVHRDDQLIDAVAQTTKQGYVFVFDRDTGEPLFPIEEREVPLSPIPGEQAWPTQPIPVAPPPFARQQFGEKDITRISPEAHAETLEQFRKLLPAVTYAPFGPEPRIMMPGFDGAATWGGPAFSPHHQVLVINSQDRPSIGQVAQLQGGSSPGAMVYNAVCAACHMPDLSGTEDGVPALSGIADRYDTDQVKEIIRNGRGRMVGMPLPDAAMDMLVDFLMTPPAEPADDSSSGQYAFTGYRRFMDPEGYPAIQPPWGTLTAIDLNRGEFMWQSVLGEHEELTRRGIPKTGTLNYGGPVVTAGGLVFIAGTMDSRIRAFDLETGAELWSAALPAPAYATPAVYGVGGQQYLVVACGGGKLGSPSSDAYLAFRLPQLKSGKVIDGR
jgi:quinoprotein glucose dehydrogenase